MVREVKQFCYLGDVLDCRGGGVQRKSNKGQSWGSLAKLEGNIKPSGNRGYTTAPAWKGIRGLHMISHALPSADVGTYWETDKYIQSINFI